MYTGDKNKRKAWAAADEDELTPSVIWRLAWDIRKGKAGPEQARRLLRHFLDRTEGSSDPLLEYLRDAFTEYLTDPRPGALERLLGLTRGRGKPIDLETERRHHVIAWEVLQQRLEGSLLFDAAFDVAEKVGMSVSRVQDAWAKHKHQALDLETVSRGRESPDKKARWTDEEMMRLKEIYGDYIIDNTGPGRPLKSPI